MENPIKKTFILLLLSTLFFTVKANDGAFYSRGNQLIPIVETDISVRKEILKIERIMGTYGTMYQVTVLYEFYNPTEPKDLLVGFEAAPPSLGADFISYPNHPCIFNFKTVMNGINLPYEVAHVPYPVDSDGYPTWKIGNYYHDGRFEDLTQEQCEEISYNKEYDYYYDDWRFYYVYHFNAHFNKGINFIQHTYRFEGSGYVMTDYIFDYVLTAANRWANNGIDDFTLEVDMGDRESFYIRPTFFKGTSNWSIEGKGKIGQETINIYDFSSDEEKRPVFHIREGKAVFHKKNFHPTGELYVSKPNYYYGEGDFDPFLKQYYHLSSWFYEYFVGKVDSPERKRILKNLPFAYRGYVFKSADLQRYFESTDWYIPNPDYESNMEEMSTDEKDWIHLMSN